jgi:hypothetical protein
MAIPLSSGFYGQVAGFERAAVKDIYSAATVPDGTSTLKFVRFGIGAQR